ncbi:hypothetical protein BC831DRAFT_441810 [Entophlyctis helioformis]|nr:hypothetical protein BC831DRAFT_441810 [Entophlyctis helioformis]
MASNNSNNGGGGGTAYYQALGVDRSADDAAIKKAYRRMALRYHPDKAGSDPATIERFQLIQKAYETLSDEKKRKIYDTYGEQGLVMLDSMGMYAPFLDPETILAINWVFFVGSALAALLLLFPSLVSLRADGRVSWSWLVVFTPMFIVDVCVIGYLFTLKSTGSDEKEETDKEGERAARAARARTEAAATEIPVSAGEASASASASASADASKDKGSTKPATAASADDIRPSAENVGSSTAELNTDSDEDLGGGDKSKKPGDGKGAMVVIKFVILFYLTLLTLFQVLIALKLDARISSSWAIVFVPWFILETVHFVLAALQATFEIQHNQDMALAQAEREKDEAGFSTRESHQTPAKPSSLPLIFKNYGTVVLRITQAILFLLKVDGTLASLDWRIVFLPTWLWSIVQLTALTLVILQQRKLAPPPESDEPGPMPTAIRIGVFILEAVLLYTGAGLLVQRLVNDPNGTSPSAAVILIPVFILTSLLLCVCACVLPILFAVARNQIHQNMNQGDPEAVPSSPLIAAGRRIEAAASSVADISSVGGKDKGKALQL